MLIPAQRRHIQVGRQRASACGGHQPAASSTPLARRTSHKRQCIETGPLTGSANQPLASDLGLAASLQFQLRKPDH